MKIRKFFLSTPEEKEATEAIGALKEKKHLRPRDLKKISRLQRVTRRRLLRLGVVGAGVMATGVAGAILFDEDAPPLKQPSPSVENADRFLMQPEQVRRLYNDSFDLIMGNIPDSSDDPDLQQLIEIKSFKRDSAMWFLVEGGDYLAFETSHLKPAALAIIPPDHPLARKQKHLINLDVNAKSKVFGNAFSVSSIRPDNITPEWAGIELTYHLSHLKDKVQVSKGIPFKPNHFGSTITAFSTAIQAIDSFTNGRFNKAVQEQIKRFRLNTTKDVDQLRANHPDQWDQISTSLGALITSESPLCALESQIRDRFYYYALCAEIINSSDLSFPKRLGAKMKVSERAGH